MEIKQLRCFVTISEHLHFGHAAHRLGILPASLGREIRLLEESLGVRLLVRTTRHVALTEEGTRLLPDARRVVSLADEIQLGFRAGSQEKHREIHVGAIDSAAAGLMPALLHDLKLAEPDITVRLFENKTVQLLPRLLSGRLDLVLIRPPDRGDRRIHVQRLFNETVVVAVAASHRLAARETLDISDLADERLIVPDRRFRPHSYDFTMKLFNAAGLEVKIAQVADEKQTIINLVAAGIGVAVVPLWASRLVVSGVKYIPLSIGSYAHSANLPLAVAWLKDVRDERRDRLLALLLRNIQTYALHH